MKNRPFYCLAALFFISVYIPAFAQTTEPSGFSYAIVAGKNGIERRYNVGSKILLKFTSDSSIQKARGYFAGITNGKIAILSKKISKEAALISADSILLLRRIRPTQRIIYAAGGVTLIGTGAAILDKAGNTSGNSGAAVLIIPVIGAGVYFLCAVPVSLFFEIGRAHV